MDESKKTIKLLLVDDEAEFRSATRQALSRRGFEVVEAENGAQAFELIPETKPDLVILDLRMDGLSGIDTLEVIRETHPSLPVIILTGHGRLDDALSGIRLKIADFLQKPVDVEKLAARIRVLLGGRKTKNLEEGTIARLMVPVSSYLRVYDDEPVGAVVQAMRKTMLGSVPGSVIDHGHRTVLVFGRDEQFRAAVRIGDLLKLVQPTFLESPYSSFFTGMFLAQCKLLGSRTAGDLVYKSIHIDIDAPLMEAVHLMVFNNLINLPVMRNGELAGVLRDKDLLLEIAEAMGGE